MPRVLIADAISDEATRLLTDARIEADVKAGRTEDEIAGDIAQYDGMIVRSATQVTPRIIEAGEKLQVIGRAGVGVDNIDVDAATERGVVVMNTPLGNIVSAAEHTVALLMALARDIPAANAEVKEGVWNRKGHVGVEVEGKVLGIIGLGRVGQHVVRVCKALGMTVVGCDPFLNPERAEELGVELAELDAVLARADFLTLHTPRTRVTEGLIGVEAIGRMKPTARVVNVSRGGIVDEQALARALQEGRIAGAALDVFDSEPLGESPLRDAPNVILTPHLGASTAEAQTKVADAIARQFVTFFTTGQIVNAVNIEAAIEPHLAPYARLATTLGSLAVQMLGGGRVRSVRCICQGKIARENTRALAVCALQGVLRETSTTPVNLVNASRVAETRGIELVEVSSRQIRNYVNLMIVEVQAAERVRRVSGTCFDGRELRIVAIDEVEIDLKPAEEILIMRYPDRPGMVGKFGTILGNARVNIASMDVGRVEKGQDAIVALTLDDPVSEGVQEALREAIGASELCYVSL